MVERKSFYKGLAMGGVVGTLFGLSVGLPITMKKAEKPSRITAREVPSISVADDHPYYGYRIYNYFDSDLDRRTVERFQTLTYLDAGTGQGEKVITDITRGEMTEMQKSFLDEEYQRNLSGHVRNSERIIVNRMNF